VEQRKLTEHRQVPVEALYLTFHGPDRKSDEYHAMDLMTDILSNGHSSRLFRRLVKEKKLFSELHGYQTGQLDENLIVVEGKLAPGVSMDHAETEIWKELENIKNETINEEELTKVKNKIEATIEFSEMSVLNKAMNLAYFELLGDADDVNREVENYRKVTASDIMNQAKKIFRKENNCVLYYLKNGATN
jgi:predicted Zn-dependent peptidase